MYCRNCGSDVPSLNTTCTKCGFLPLTGNSYCQECGQITGINQEYCSYCNTDLRHLEEAYFTNKNYVNKVNDDVPNAGANIAACCSLPFTGGLPIVGLILYLVWKDNKPNAANSVCLWSLFPFIFIVLFYILFFILGGLSAFL